MGMAREMRRLADQLNEANADILAAQAAMHELEDSSSFHLLSPDCQQIVSMVSARLRSIRSTLNEVDDSITN